MSKPLKPVSIEEFKALLFAAADSHLSNNEPIPVMHKINEQKVASCLIAPFQSVFGKTLYRGFFKKASILFYLLIKNHPLENGNKRMAVLTLLYFAILNDRIIKMPEMLLYDLSKEVAKSKDKDFTLVIISSTLRKYTSEL